jgi:FkbM family methyltransferase
MCPGNLGGAIRFVSRIRNRFSLIEILLRGRSSMVSIKIGERILTFNDVGLENLSNLYEIFGKENYSTDVPAETILDLGAYQGYYSMYAYVKYPDAVIYSFEPLPDNYLQLKKNIEFNKLGSDRLKLFNVAISESAGKVSLHMNDDAKMGSSIVYKTGKAMEVPAVTISEIIRSNRIEKIDILKVDIEGAEYRVFRGADDDVMSKIDTVIAEFHPVEGEKMSDLVQLFEGKGLLLRSADESGQIYFFSRKARGVG